MIVSEAERIGAGVGAAVGSPDPATIESDVCIVGGGAAGITLALELESTGRRILLLEAGGLAYEPATQRLLEGETVGDALPPLRDTRLAALGGSTEVFAGYYRELDAQDFEAGPGRPGWPFGRDALTACYRRARELCGLPSSSEADEEPCLVTSGGVLMAGDADVRHVAFHINPLGFGARYRGRLDRSDNIRVLLHAPVVRLRADDSGGMVERAEVRRLDGRALTVRARQFVIAAGGIENARLLLLSGDAPERAIGNGHGQVGRWFSEHAFVEPGMLLLSRPPARLDAYFPAPAPDRDSATRVRQGWALAQCTAEREGIHNGAWLLHPRYEAHAAFVSAEVRSLLTGIDKLKGRDVPGGAAAHFARALRAPHRVGVALLRKTLVADRPAHRWRVRAMFATESRAENRVTLANRTDRLGRPLARVEWRLGDHDLSSMRRGAQLLDAALRRAGQGRLELAFEDEASAWRAATIGGKHQMGATRMHHDPAQGVVDEHGRVHGTSNLYLAGSSVFPYGGYANPTLTIVALAVRLAEHLRRTD